MILVFWILIRRSMPSLQGNVHSAKSWHQFQMKKKRVGISELQYHQTHAGRVHTGLESPKARFTLDLSVHVVVSPDGRRVRTGKLTLRNMNKLMSVYCTVGWQKFCHPSLCVFRELVLLYEVEFVLIYNFQWMCKWREYAPNFNCRKCYL